MDTPEKKPKIPKQGTELEDKLKKLSKEKERQKRIEEVARQMHPHNDEPDPTAYMGNYNFPQMLFAFCLGFATMFVLSIKEIENFKGCPFPAYFDDPPRSTIR
mgnify:CR=1 FL=1|jgi:hypothetical protein